MESDDQIELKGVREYESQQPVFSDIEFLPATIQERDVVVVKGPCRIDLVDLLTWVKNNRSDIFKRVGF